MMGMCVSSVSINCVMKDTDTRILTLWDCHRQSRSEPEFHVENGVLRNV